VGDAGAYDAYTVQEAARILRTTERTVRRRLERGDLEGTRDPTTGRWRAATRSVPAAMPERPPKPASLEEPLEAPESLQGYQERARPSRGSWDVSRGACNLRRSPRARSGSSSTASVLGPTGSRRNCATLGIGGPVGPGSSDAARTTARFVRTFAEHAF
jgi:excisionase family DNA binding protein